MKTLEEIEELFKNERERQFNEYMGVDYQREWKYPKKVLEEGIERRHSRVKKLKELNIPQTILQNEQEKLDKLTTMWAKKLYASNKLEEQYFYNYHEKMDNFVFNPKDLYKYMDQEKLAEIDRRFNDIREHIFEMDHISSGMTGSDLHFVASLSLMGYPFKHPPKWMTTTPILTDEEYNSLSYYTYIRDLHLKLRDEFSNHEEFREYFLHWQLEHPTLVNLNPTWINLIKKSY